MQPNFLITFTKFFMKATILGDSTFKYFQLISILESITVFRDVKRCIREETFQCL
jgi:hypothetical protein